VKFSGGKKIEGIIKSTNLLCQTNSTSPDNAGQPVELCAAVIDRLGIELSQFEVISDKVAEWVDELADALAFN
jgi:hypothetical protein